MYRGSKKVLVADTYFFNQKIHKIRITLTSRKVQSLEKVCSELLDRAKSKQLHVKGPVRLPTKTLKVQAQHSLCSILTMSWLS